MVNNKWGELLVQCYSRKGLRQSLDISILKIMIIQKGCDVCLCINPPSTKPP